MSDCSKVYCTQCAYFNSCKKSNARISYDDNNLHETCNAPQNIRSTYMSDGSDKYISAPSIINKYNNCKWFTPKAKGSDIIAIIDAHNRDPKSHPYLISKINEVDNKLEEADIRIQYNLDLHKNDNTNPHKVTKDQVGLDQVDNTSDINKPVSKLTREAIAVVSRSVESEAIRAIGEENLLNQKVLALAEKDDYLDHKIDEETIRARAAESTLTSDIDLAKVECKQFAKDQDNGVKNYALDVAADEREKAITESKQYTNTVKAELEREIEEKTSGLWHYKGKVNFRRDLDAIVSKAEGDIYTVLFKDDGTELNSEFIWTGSKWEELGSIIDLKDYYKKAEVDSLIATERAYVDGSFHTAVKSEISMGDAEIFRLAKIEDQTNFTTLDNKITEAKTDAVNQASALDTHNYNYIIKPEIDAAEARAITEAGKLDDAKYSTITADIAVAKGEAINEAGNMDAALYVNVTEDIGDAKDAAIAASKSYTDSKIGESTKGLSEHIANNSAHNIPNQLSETLGAAKTYSDGKLATESQNLKDDYDSKINTVKSTYLPLTGNKIVTGKVDFQNTISVKDSVTGSTTLEINTTGFSKTSTVEGVDPVVVNLPETSGTLARKEEIAAAKTDILQTLNTHASNTFDAHNVSNRITTAKEAAISEAKRLANEYTDEKVGVVSTEVNNVKSTYLPLTGNKQVTGKVDFQNTIAIKNTPSATKTLTINTESLTVNNGSTDSNPVVIELPSESGVIARKSELESTKTQIETDVGVAIGAISETVNEHILNETDAHKVDERIAAAKTAAHTDAEGLVNASYQKVTNETNTKIDNVKSTYLPLTGDKVVTGTVEFQKQVKAKDSITDQNTLVIGSKSFTIKNNNGNPDIVIALPDSNGTIAKTSNVIDLENRINSTIATQDTRIDALEEKIPSDITSVISQTSTSDKKDVPNNYAVRTALATKANSQEVYNKEAADAKFATVETVTGIVSNYLKKTDAENTYATKTQVSEGLATKANSSDVTAALETKANKGTTLASYGITDAYTKDEVKSLVASTFRYKGSKPTYEDLPKTGNEVGDVWNIIGGTYAGANFVWSDSNKWDKLSETIDISGKQDAITAVKHAQDTKVGSLSVPVYVTRSGEVAPVDVDDAVTENSNNLVTSKAIYNSVNDKYTQSKAYTDTEVAKRALASDVYTKTETDDKIDVAKTAVKNHSDAQDIVTRNECKQYADNKDAAVTTECKNYTDYQVSTLNNRHYSIKTISDTAETPNEYLVSDYATNNIDLTGKTGDVYIYLPPATTSLTGKSREFIVNVSNRVSTCIIHFATLDEESAEFRDGGVLDTVKNEKEEFSLKFQEYDTSKFLVDQVGMGDTTNNKKITINESQLSLVDSSGDVWKFQVVNGQLKLNKVSVN